MPKFYLDTEEKGKGYIVGWMGRLQKTRDGQNNRKGGSSTPPIEGDDFSFAASGAVVEPSILQVQKPSDRLGDFTVVRGSSATYVDSDGIIKEAIFLGDELVTNGDFEDGSTGWSSVAGWEISGGSANGNGGGASTYMEQVGVVEVGKTYRIEYDVSNYSSGQARVFFSTQEASSPIIEDNGHYSQIYEATTSTTVSLKNQSGLFNGSIDNISVKEVSFDMARIDWTNGVGELLTEPQSTNLYLQSGGSAVENTTVTATPYTVSFYGTGVLTFSGAYTGSLIGTGENERVSLTFTPTAGTLTTSTSGTITYKQCENLAYATSVIITNGSTVTRLQDVITDGGNVNVINSEEGTMFFEGSYQLDGLTKRFYITDGTINNRIVVIFSDVSVIIEMFVNNVVQTQLTFTDSPSLLKIAFKWKLNDFALWVNGVEIEVDVSGLSFPIDTLNIFDLSDITGARNFFGRTRELKVYDRALTDEELQNLTTL